MSKGAKTGRRPPRTNKPARHLRDRVQAAQGTLSVVAGTGLAISVNFATSKPTSIWLWLAVIAALAATVWVSLVPASRSGNASPVSGPVRLALALTITTYAVVAFRVSQKGVRYATEDAELVNAVVAGTAAVAVAAAAAVGYALASLVDSARRSITFRVALAYLGFAALALFFANATNNHLLEVSEQRSPDATALAAQQRWRAEEASCSSDLASAKQRLLSLDELLSDTLAGIATTSDGYQSSGSITLQMTANAIADERQSTLSETELLTGICDYATEQLAEVTARIDVLTGSPSKRVTELPIRPMLGGMLVSLAGITFAITRRSDRAQDLQAQPQSST